MYSTKQPLISCTLSALEDGEGGVASALILPF